MTTFIVCGVVFTAVIAFALTWYLGADPEYTIDLQRAIQDVRTELISKNYECAKRGDEIDRLTKQIGLPPNTICLPEHTWYYDVLKLREELATCKARCLAQEKAFHTFAKAVGCDCYPKCTQTPEAEDPPMKAVNCTAYINHPPEAQPEGNTFINCTAGSNPTPSVTSGAGDIPIRFDPSRYDSGSPKCNGNCGCNGDDPKCPVHGD
jgi:hypothetical protein